MAKKQVIIDSGSIVTESEPIKKEIIEVVEPQITESIEVDILPGLTSVQIQEPEEFIPDIETIESRYFSHGNKDMHPDYLELIIDPDEKGGSIVIEKRNLLQLYQFFNTNNKYRFSTIYPKDIKNNIISVRFEAK